MKNERTKRKKKKIRSWIKLLIIVIIGLGLYFFMSSSLFTVKEFKVEGNNYYTDEEILVMGNCVEGKNIFWGNDLKDIKKRLEKDAYMENVSVKRVLPDTISIKLTERVQMAAVAYGDKFVVIDSNGIVLRKAGVDPKVTVVKGLTISKLQIGEPLEAEENVLLRQSLELLRQMTEGNMYFKEIRLSEGEIKAYVLKNLVCKGTPENLIKALKSNKLQLAVQQLLDDDIQRGTLKVSGQDYISFTPKID